MIYLYGIPNCDSIKKARRWLDGKGLDHTFLNFKKQGADRATVEKWADRCGWESLLNRRGTTFRKLDESDKVELDREKAIDLMLQHTSLIKRPIAEHEDGQRTLVGFSESEWENALC